MKIILVTHSFFPHSVGGRETYVYGLAKALGEAGNEVKVFTCSDSPFKKYKKEEEWFTVYYLPTIRLSLPTGYYRIPPTLFFELLKTDADVVHAHDIHHFTTLISGITGKIARKRFLLTEHGYSEQFGIERLFIKFYDKFLSPVISKCSNRIIAISNFIKEELIHRYKVPKNKIQVIHNFVDLREFKKKKDIFRQKYDLKKRKVVLLVGRMIREKGFQHMVKALPIVSKKIPNVKLVIIGPTNYYENELKKLVKELKMEDKVVFCGTVPDEVLKSAFLYSDVVVIPSVYEPFGLVALEAMAYGKPIVASRVGGLAEFLKHKRNSLLFQPGDVNQLANHVVDILTDKSIAKKISKVAKKNVKKFGLKRFTEEMIRVYKTAIDTS